jgi:hypothetical protein
MEWPSSHLQARRMAWAKPRALGRRGKCPSDVISSSARRAAVIIASVMRIPLPGCILHRPLLFPGEAREKRRTSCHCPEDTGALTPCALPLRCQYLVCIYRRATL